MRNAVLTADQAAIIAADRWPLFATTDEILLPSGCQLAQQRDGTYLLKGYASDSTDFIASMEELIRALTAQLYA